MGGSGFVVVAAILLLYAALSRRLDGTSVTAALLFVGAGFLVGTAGFGWLDLESNSHTVSTLAEATLVIVLFSDASRIDLGALRREYSVPARLLGIGLPLTIAAGTVAAVAVVRELSWSEALVLAVVLASTDAALGQAVVTDESLPSRVRQGLNVESGLNDGLCVPLLTIALAIAETDTGGTSGAHATRLVAEAIGWGVVGGVIAGAGAAFVLRTARSRGWIAAHWVQIVPVAAAVAAFGLADERGGSGFIAAFVGGAIYGRLAGGTPNDSAFSEEIGAVLDGVTLIVFGAAVLGSLWSDIELHLVIYAVLSLTVVRMVPVAIAMIGSRARPATVLFMGWFGPRGLASIVFGVVVVEGAQLPHVDTLVITIAVTVAISVIAHGVTAAPLARRYAARSSEETSPMEWTPVPHQRWRHRLPPT